MRFLTLIRFAFRELLSKATLYVLLGISTLILLGTLVSVSSEVTDEGAVLKVFGNPAGPPTPVEEFEQRVSGMQAGLAGGLFVGIMLFGVFATAGIIPDSLEKGTVDLYLSKPLARWEFLLGKYLGGVAVIGAAIIYFIAGVWLGFGVRVGVWNLNLLLSGFTLTFMFAVIFSLVIFFGVIFRNMAIPIIACFLYLMFIDNLLENREQILYLFSESTFYRRTLDVLYYLFPQIAGMQQGLTQQITHQPMAWSHFAQSLASAALFFLGSSFLLKKKDF